MLNLTRIGAQLITPYNVVCGGEKDEKTEVNPKPQKGKKMIYLIKIHFRMFVPYLLLSHWADFHETWHE